MCASTAGTGSSPSIVSSRRACSSVLKSGWLWKGSSSLYRPIGIDDSRGAFRSFSSRCSWMARVNRDEVSAGIRLLLSSVARGSAPDCKGLSTERLRRRDRAGGLLDPVLAGPLRLVEGAIGLEDELVRRRSLGEGGDAEARGEDDRRAVGADEDAVPQRLAHALGELGGAVAIGAREDEQELLPAPARDEVDVADGLPQDVGKLAQRDVAGRVAVAVVHVLEAVEVGEVMRSSSPKRSPKSVSVPKLERPAESGSSSRSCCGSSEPIRATSPLAPTIVPPAAPVASTAVSTITRRSWLGSWVAASASPKRENASRSRPRSASSSSSRASRSEAMSLKARPSTASSSRPRTRTRSSRRPRASARAAAESSETVRTIVRPSK